MKQSDNLAKLKLEKFQHLATPLPETNTEQTISGNNAEESIEVEYLKYTDASMASVQSSKTFSLLSAAEESEVTLTITNEHAIDDRDSTGDVSCDLDDLSCTVDYFVTDNETTTEEQDKSDPDISATANINLPCPTVRAIDDHLQQLSQIVDIFTDQI